MFHFIPHHCRGGEGSSYLETLQDISIPLKFLLGKEAKRGRSK